MVEREDSDPRETVEQPETGHTPAASPAETKETEEFAAHMSLGGSQGHPG